MKKKANSIWCSQAVTHPSTDQTQRCLTSLIAQYDVTYVLVPGILFGFSLELY